MKLSLMAVVCALLAGAGARPTGQDFHNLLVHQVDFFGATGNLLESQAKVLHKAAGLGTGLGAALGAIVGHHESRHHGYHHHANYHPVDQQVHANYHPVDQQVHANYYPVDQQVHANYYPIHQEVQHHELLHSYGLPDFQ